MKEHVSHGLLLATIVTLVAEVGFAQESPEVVRELAGTIVDREGQPVADAVLFTHAMGERERTSCETKSNKQGEFVITVPPEWPHHVNMHTWILADGYAAKIVRPGVVLDDGLGRRNVTITLDRPNPAEFLVQDPSGKAFANAKVRLEYMNSPSKQFAIDKPSGYSMYVAPELKERFTRTTDAQGRVTLDFVTKSLVHGVTVLTPEYGEQQISFHSRLSKTLKLQPVGELTVKVEGESAAEFAGTQLSVNSGNGVTYHCRQTVTLDETGQAHLPVVMIGKIGCSLPDKEVNGRLLVAAGDVEIKAGGSHVFRLTPQKSVRVVGSVLTKDTKQPIAGASVRLSAGSRHFLGQSGETDSEGKFALRVAPGDYRLSCSLNGADATFRERYYLDASVVSFRQPRIRIKAGVAEHVVNPILVPPKSRVRGQVRNLDSEPIANVTIMLIPSRRTIPILTVETDRNGRFEADAKESDVTSRANRWVVVERDDSNAGYREVMSLYARDDDPKSLVLVQAE